MFSIELFIFYQSKLIFLPFLILVVHAKKVYSCTNPQLLDSELKKVALSTFAIALLLLIFLPNV